MTKKEKKEKVSIYNLFEKEKIVTFKDDSGRESDILFVKMNQNEYTEALNIYNKKLAEERKGIKDKESETSEIKNLLSSLSSEEIIESTLAMEGEYRKQIADIYPIEDEKEKSKEEKEKERKKLVDSWYAKRKKELEDMPEEEVLEMLIDLRMESLAMIRASIEVNSYCIHCMARVPETKEKVFSTPDKVFELKDSTLVTKMVDIVQQFRESNGDRAVREVAQSGNFTQSGQSQK